MRKTILFIAMSLDGYISNEYGKVDWINGQNQNAENIDTYSTFIKDIDTVIMGWNTYNQIITELSPEKWFYSDLISYVITHRELSSTNNIIFTKSNPSVIIENLKKKQGKNIWICGGANIVQQLMQDDLIDEYHISIIPTILGSGTRLFEKTLSEIKLELINTQSYNGIIELIYKHRSF